ncbi:MAG: sigma-70 family RNA polymerase sigma factor [Polyangiaceae bacterium]|nr:sigma-70 family RNA polymerase sigma factor [Polyangiaceae bacterium]
MNKPYGYARAFLGEMASDQELAPLDAQLSEHMSLARAAWPMFQIVESEFIAYLASKSEALDLSELVVGDLYLVFGCLKQERLALGAFEEQYLTKAIRTTRRTTPSIDVEDLAQALLEHLVVGSETRGPKLADYAGKGSLAAWLRVVVTRSALNMATRRPKEDQRRTDDEALLDSAIGSGPEDLRFLKNQYDAEIREVIPRALTQISFEARLLLRQRYLDKLSIADLSRLHKVHDATVKRQIARALNDLNSLVRLGIAERLKLSPSELDSVIRTVRSEFYVTLGRIWPAEPHE